MAKPRQKFFQAFSKKRAKLHKSFLPTFFADTRCAPTVKCTQFVVYL